MQFAKTMLFLLVALFWSVAPSHCKLEAIPAFSFIACDDSGDCDPATSCEDDACKTVEEGFYFHKQQSLAAITVVPVLPLVFSH